MLKTHQSMKFESTVFINSLLMWIIIPFNLSSFNEKIDQIPKLIVK